MDQWVRPEKITDKSVEQGHYYFLINVCAAVFFISGESLAHFPNTVCTTKCYFTFKPTKKQAETVELSQFGCFYLHDVIYVSKKLHTDVVPFLRRIQNKHATW